MKNIYFKSFIVITFVALLFSCDQGDSRFGDDTSTLGWIEFRTAASSTGSNPTVIEIPLDINVPVYQEGINITYTVTPVNGDYTQFVNTTGGTIFVDPVDVTRTAIISLPFQNEDVVRCDSIDFDVTLTADDVDGVSLGVDNDSVLTHRVTIAISENPTVLPDTYFVGEYNIEDTLATIGPGNGTENFESGTIMLMVDSMNPNKRTFMTGILPAFTGASFDISIDFTADNVVQLDLVGSGIGCSAPEYSFGPIDDADAVAGDAATSWSICDDSSITINYVEDPNGSCAGPYAASFTLTKL